MKGIKLILPAFALHLPEVSDPEKWILGSLPPTVPTEQGLQIDFSPLLMVNHVIMDETAVEMINSKSDSYLKQVRDSIHILKEEGFISVFSYANVIKKHKVFIEKTKNFHLRRPDIWLPEIRKQIATWNEIHESSIKQFIPDQNDPTLTVPFGIGAYLQTEYGSIDLSEANRLTLEIQSKRINRTNSELDELRMVVAPYLAQTITNLTLQHELSAPIYDWDDFKPFYMAPCGIYPKNE